MAYALGSAGLAEFEVGGHDLAVAHGAGREASPGGSCRLAMVRVDLFVVGHPQHVDSLAPGRLDLAAALLTIVVTTIAVVVMVAVRVIVVLVPMLAMVVLVVMRMLVVMRVRVAVLAMMVVVFVVHLRLSAVRVPALLRK